MTKSAVLSSVVQDRLRARSIKVREELRATALRQAEIQQLQQEVAKTRLQLEIHAARMQSLRDLQLDLHRAMLEVTGPERSFREKLVVALRFWRR